MVYLAGKYIFRNFASTPKTIVTVMIKKTMLLLYAVVMALCLSAQPYCDVSTFTIRDGLAANIISGFTQSKNNLMWFSTWNGLCCYDGYHFMSFRSTPGAGETLSTNRIMIIKPSAGGNLWCCTSDRNVYMFDTRKCVFVNVSKMIAEQYGENISVRNIYPLANGHTWVVSGNGRANFRISDSLVADGGGIEEYSVRKGNLKTNGLHKIELDGEGREWIFSNRGIQLHGTGFSSEIPFENMVSVGKTVYFATLTGLFYSYVPGGSKMRKVSLPAGISKINDAVRYGKRHILLATDIGVVVYDTQKANSRVVPVQHPSQPSPEAVALFTDSRHRVWAYTGGPGITLVDLNTLTATWLQSEADSPLHRTSSDKPFFHQDQYGTVWLCPAGGTFCYYDEQARRLQACLLKSDARSDYFFPAIAKFFPDRDKNIWFTGTRDVNLINFKYHHFKHTSVEQNQEVRSVFIDSKRRTWAGSYNGVVAVYDANRRLEGYLGKDGRIHRQRTIFANRIYSFYEDAEGWIWIGTKGDGLYITDLNGTVLHCRYNPSDKFSLSNDYVYDIDVDSRGHTWIATFDGGLNLVQRQGGALRFVSHRNLMPQYPMKDNSKIRRVTHTPGGAVILSTTGGLVTFSDRFASPSSIRFHTSRHIVADTTSLMGSDVLQTLVTSRGDIIVATLGAGVQRLKSASPLAGNLRFGSLQGVRPDQGIVQSLAEDNAGNVWIVRESSIDKYDMGSGTLMRYGENNIGLGVELSEAKPAHGVKDNIITVGKRGGVVSFSPGHLRMSTLKPNIVFTGVLYQGENETEPILDKTVLDIESNRRNLTIYFAALDYSDKYLVQYAYKIEGIDHDWNYVGTTNSASFNHLPAGRYRLLVKSTNSDGVWVDNVSALSIFVRPTFWESGWATLLYLLLAIGVITLAVYIYNLRSRAAMERELNQMKTKFFTEISHKLRTPLTLIGGPVGEVLRTASLAEGTRRHLEMVHRNAMQMLDLVNRMLRYSVDRGVYISTPEDGALTAQLKGTETAEIPSGEQAFADKNLRLLVVEDNDDLREFLVEILSPHYTVMQAADGQQGLRIAEQDMPDFIITDVMMPVMDGLTMVHRIKQNANICHIPIIVLSAKASLADRLQGLDEGIDDYITKPFSAIYLKSRVFNIINQRRLLQQTYVTQITPDNKQSYRLESPQIVDSDKEMMNKLMAFLEERLGDSSVRIEEMAEAVNLSRSVFYGKMKSIVGMSPIDFLRHVRMQRAEELVAKSDLPFSQIGYQVGFSDPKYFSKCFKRDVGMTPSEYRERKRNESNCV